MGEDTIGRYVVRAALAGEKRERAFLAYDPALDRQVVVRLVDQGSAWRLSALRAAAAIEHPAVVPIFDVGRAAEGDFVASGHVEGRPLETWARERPRSWRETVDIFLQAGGALCAAHARGLAHGSFGPGRMTVGWDGRAYVDGFGDTSGGSAEADLRAFAATLQEALIAFGAEAPGFVRRALRDVLGGGAPGQPPSLRGLLDHLTRDPAAVRRRRLSLFAAGAAALVLTLFFYSARSPAPCTGARLRLAGVWDEAIRAEVGAAFERTARPEAGHALRMTQQRLDAYAREWARAHESACLAHARGEQASTALDLRMSCLVVRRQELGALASVLREADAAVVRKAAAAASSLLPIARCADVATLEKGPNAPADPVTRARAEALGESLARARALQHAGRYREAETTARTVISQARELGHAPLRAEAATLVGILEQRARRTQAAEESLIDGALTALGAGHDRAVAKASASLVSLEYQNQTRLLQSGFWAARARSALKRTGSAREVERELERRLGDLAIQRGSYAEAVTHFERAQRLTPEDNTPARAVAEDRLGRVQRLLGQPSQALLHHERALRLFEQAHGPHHPNVAIALHAVALALRSAGRLREAVQHHERALVLQRATLGVGHADLAGMENALAITLWHLGDAPGALTRFSAALEVYRRRFGPKHVVVATLENNMARVFSRLGRDSDAVSAASRAVALYTELQGPRHAETAHALAVLAQCQRRRAPRLALETITRALAIEEAKEQPRSPGLRSALATLGRILVDLGRPAAARDALLRAESLSKPADGDHIARLTALGSVHASLGEEAAAEAALTRAVHLARTTEGDPREAGRAYLALARALWPKAERRATAEALVAQARAAFAAARPVDRSGLAQLASFSTTPR